MSVNVFHSITMLGTLYHPWRKYYSMKSYQPHCMLGIHFVKLYISKGLWGYAPVTLSRFGSPTRPTWFFTKVGEVGNKMSPTFLHNDSAPTKLRHCYDSSRFSSDIAPTCPDLATWSDLSRFSYDLPRFIQTYADWALTGADLTPT
jgi:hypothetical protein